MNKLLLIGITIILVIVALFSFGKFTGNVVANTGEFLEEGDSIKIPLSEISETAAFYNYGDIEFFIVEASDGTPKTAFNACDVCYRSKKGYRQDGEDMVCNNCGNHYPISGLGTKNLRGGGCWPGYLPNTVEGDYIVIKKFDLESGAYRF
jgi:uncharacterized membrane protein